MDITVNNLFTTNDAIWPNPIALCLLYQ